VDNNDWCHYCYPYNNTTLSVLEGIVVCTFFKMSTNSAEEESEDEGKRVTDLLEQEDEDGKPNAAGRKRKSSSVKEEQGEPSSRPEPRRSARTAKKPKIQSNPGRLETDNPLSTRQPKKSAQKRGEDHDENKIGELPNLPHNIDQVVQYIDAMYPDENYHARQKDSRQGKFIRTATLASPSHNCCSTN
jgi:hypothetical protein